MLFVVIEGILIVGLICAFFEETRIGRKLAEKLAGKMMK